MVIFRENTEDIYAGLEFEEGTPEALRLLDMLARSGASGRRSAATPGLGIKPISITGSKRLIRAAINYAIEHDRPSVTMVHKGNIQKFTEGAFTKWGYDLVREEFATRPSGWDDCGGKPGDKVLVKDNIADITLQQVLTRPRTSTSSPRPTSTATTSQTRSPPRSAGSASRRAPTSTTSPATASSRRPTGRPRSTPARTRSTPDRCCCRA